MQGISQEDWTVRYAFRVTSSFLAEVAMDLDKERIIKELITEAEKLGLNENDYAVFQLDDLGLKVVVRFAQRLIHVMTNEEAATLGIPGCGPPGGAGPKP
jgi:hypothetical protein